MSPPSGGRNWTDEQNELTNLVKNGYVKHVKRAEKE